jgi:hypothetical protein
MRLVSSSAIVLISIALSPIAIAGDSVAFQDDSEDLLDDDDLDETAEEKRKREELEKKRLDDDDRLDGFDEEGELDAIDDSGDKDGEEGDGEDGEEGDGEDGDLLGEVTKDSIGGVGEDNSTIYRKAMDDYADMIPDEQMLAWERYLEKYPNSLYRDRIDKRMDELEGELYKERIRTDDPGRLDADQKEIYFSQGLTIENINPRSRIQSGFEWGLPDYINLVLDYEQQVKRNFSFHAGFRRRYTGPSIEGGVRYALIKSSRTKTLLTAIGDVHLNALPAFLGIRPQLAFGKQFGALDLQIQGGVDVETRPMAGWRLIGGANATYRANDDVSIFLESQVHMKDLAWEMGNYRFNTMSFGMKFYPALKSMKKKKQMEVNFGATVPYTANWWMFHYGSIMGQMNWYL